jgi:hypothetical protein
MLLIRLKALDFHRKQHEEQGKTFIYNWHNREKLDTSLVISKKKLKKNCQWRSIMLSVLKHLLMKL